MNKNIVHGFELPPGQKKVWDEQILDLDKDQITLMMEKLSYFEYHKWKLKKLKHILTARVEDDNWIEPNSQQRVDMTTRAIRHTENILSRWNK